MKTIPLCLSALSLCLSSLLTNATPSADASLQAILEQQSEQSKARYAYRHPYETLKFFGIKPGMTVVEVLPYSGWYTQILAPYLGKEGHIIAGDYPVDLWPHFEWATVSYIEERIEDTKDFPNKVQQWAPNTPPKISAYTLDNLPQSLNNSVDAVLYIRALHNLSRFNDEYHFMDKALAATHRVLKEGGVVGIVQHETQVKNADGANGYLNREELVAQMQKAGFTLVAASDINKNPKDQPGPNDSVWRLPPTLDGTDNNPELKKQYMAIGESNRMTLLFKK